MRATETDPTNYQLAAENVRTNQLDASISLVQVAATEIFTDKVFSVSEEEGVVFDFSMCNPPFFADIAAANSNPRCAGGGAPCELVTEGESRRRLTMDAQVSVFL